jgi:hypothetical protein
MDNVDINYIMIGYSDEYVNLLRNAKYAIVLPETHYLTLLDIAYYYIRIMLIDNHPLAEILDPLTEVSTRGAVYSTHKRLAKMSAPDKLDFAHICQPYNEDAQSRFIEWFNGIAQYEEPAEPELKKKKKRKHRSRRSHRLELEE